jgi:hypothetical protein
LIKELLIDNSQDWKSKILSQLQTYKKIAPNYHAVNQLLTDVLEREYEDMVELDQAALEAVCAYLRISKDLKVFSKMGLNIDEVTAPDEWALNICKALGFSEYWNPPGGQEFFDKGKYQRAGIDLKFQKPILREYDQKRSVFEPGLSIIDVMMFNNTESINNMLDNYELI